MVTATMSLTSSGIPKKTDPVMEEPRERLAEVVAKSQSVLERAVAIYMEPRLKAQFSASDVVVSAIGDALEKFEQFHGETEAELFAWLRTISLNKLRQKRRAEYADKRDVRKNELLTPAKDDSEARSHQLASMDKSPSDVASLNEESQHLEAALKQLDEKTLRVIELKYHSGLSRREIAEELGMTQGAVAGRIRRGLENLKQILTYVQSGDNDE